MSNYAPRQSWDGKRGGSSSFWIHDPKKAFAELDLKQGDYVLDLGCGPGDYSIQASKIVGDSGLVYSLERGKNFIDIIKEKMASQGRSNIRAIEADITRTLPIEDACIDVCLMATVLHIPQVIKAGRHLFAEIHRVLKPGGRLAIIECKKEDQPFGPPMQMRLSPEDVEHALSGHDFKKISQADLGYNYLIKFIAE